MTSFDFLKDFFEPQTLFIGAWGTKFKVLSFFKIFGPQKVKNN
jgi:hypothetical protein